MGLFEGIIPSTSTLWSRADEPSFTFSFRAHATGRANLTTNKRTVPLCL